jgi:PAS domain S-box-containing protein
MGAAILALRNQGRKQERLLRRQRRLMQARTTALRKSQAHYEALFNNVPLPVVLASPDGDVLSANPALLDLLGVGEDELKDLNFEQFYDDPGDRKKLVAYWDVSRRDVHRGELTLRRRDGQRLNVLYANRTIRALDGTIEYLQGMFTDITELRKAEAQRRELESHLRLSQKLEAVGRLAAGVAHEINTPMQYIGDNVYFLREAFESLRELLARERQLVEAAPDRRGRNLLDSFESLEQELDIDEIVHVAPRAFDRTQEGIKTVSGIVAAMKELAHPGQGAKIATDINAVIETALAIARNEYKTVAEVTTVFGDLPAIPAYKNELCQVMINLIVNAAHAIESASKDTPRPGVIRIETRVEARIVAIAVSDNGCGIPEAAREKIFDPFFTTKEVGKGTGQGLALARTTIVDKHRGEIDVDSEVGVQTTFTIRLPMGRFESQSIDIGADGCLPNQ